MKYVGEISLYFDSKRFGFIKSNQLASEGLITDDVFFHLNDCLFFPSRLDFVVFELNNDNGKVKAVNVKLPIDEIDYLLDHWNDYSDQDKKLCLSSLEKEFCNKTASQNVLSRKFDKVLSIGDSELVRMFSSFVESLSLKSADLASCCSSKLKDLVLLTFRNASGNELSFSEILPSDEELNNYFTRFLRDEKPRIIYTYTEESGYWQTNWKWDGPEDSYKEGQKYSDFETNHIFSIKKISIGLGYGRSSWSHNGSGDYEKDLSTKNQRIINLYQTLKDSRYLGDLVNKECARLKGVAIEKMVNDVYDSVRQPVLEVLRQYFIDTYKCYGKNISNWLTQHYQPADWRIDDNNYPGSGYFYIPGVNMRIVKRDLLSIFQQVYKLISSEIERTSSLNSQKFVKIFPSNTLLQGNMIMSDDRTILYAVTDTTLSKIVIPKSVTVVADGAFNGCASLREISFLGVITHIGNGVFRYPNLQISGDFSCLRTLGFNSSSSELTIGDQKKTIIDWVYAYNKNDIDRAEFIVNKKYIEHNDI